MGGLHLVQLSVKDTSLVLKDRYSVANFFKDVALPAVGNRAQHHEDRSENMGQVELQQNVSRKVLALERLVHGVVCCDVASEQVSHVEHEVAGG